jgi:hypothetical protein
LRKCLGIRLYHLKYRELEVFIMARCKIKSLKSNNLIALNSGRGRPKDVKNEGWPDYMLENTDERDRMSLAQAHFLDENTRIAR